MVKPANPEEIEKMLHLLKQGNTVAEVSRILNRKWTTVWRRLKKYLSKEEYEKLKKTGKSQRFLNSKPQFKFGFEEIENKLNKIETALERIENILISKK